MPALRHAAAVLLTRTNAGGELEVYLVERAPELRFFGGLTKEETAVALGVSRNTVDRDWRVARAWLAARLSEASDDSGDPTP